MNPQPAQRRIHAPSDGQLLSEATALVSKALGKQYVFNSRGLFYSWLVGGGMNQLVRAEAMKPLRAPDPYTALEFVVGMLRLYETRRPAESYSRSRTPVRFDRSAQHYSADEDHPRAPPGAPTVVNGKTYLPGEFIPHSEIQAEHKSLQTKMEALKGIMQAHREAKAASRAAAAPAASSANVDAIAAQAKNLFETAGHSKTVQQDAKALEANLQILAVPDLIKVAEATGMRWGKKPGKGAMIQQIISRIDQQRTDEIRHGELAY